MKLWDKLFLTKKFYYLFCGIALLFSFSGVHEVIFYLSILLLTGAITLTIIDYLKCSKIIPQVSISRRLPISLSLGDEARIYLTLINNSDQKLNIQITEDLPYQLQMRDHKFDLKTEAFTEEEIGYLVKPSIRGKYTFGNIYLYISQGFGLIELKKKIEFEQNIEVLPSIIQMKKYDLMVFNDSAHSGFKKIRRIGHSYEFEQIKTYVPGDDPRRINWKASGKLNTLMVNQYEDEKSQMIYSIIDKSRSMKKPFKNLSLLDYSINAVLAISNIIIKKQDKAGLISFSDKLGTIIKAEKKPHQLKRIINALYDEKERHLESNYEMLYNVVKKTIPNRSTIFLYTNFESYYSLERNLAILKKINKSHLLVVVFFKDSELDEYSKETPKTTLDIYNTTIAKKLINEKIKIAHELSRHGIQSIYTAPEHLSINAINKYLELKARGLS